MILKSGVDLEFSRGRLFKKFIKVLSTFFQVDQIDFPSSFKAVQRPCFGQNFCCAPGNILKNQARKGVFRNFLIKKVSFCGAASPSKLVYIGAKMFGSVSQNWISQKSTKGNPLGRSVGGMPEGGASASHPNSSPD